VNVGATFVRLRMRQGRFFQMSKQIQKPWENTELAANGRLVLENFRDWFGQSPLLDEQGLPLVLYHGSKVPFLEAFDLRFEGSGIVNSRKTSRGGIWFSPSREAASFFANPVDDALADKSSILTCGSDGAHFGFVDNVNDGSLFEVGPHKTEEAAWAAAHRAADRYNNDPERGQAIFPVYVALRNPLVLDGEIPRDGAFERARSGGHDGIVAQNVADGPCFGDVVVVFDPRRIKSATDNCGLYLQGSASLDDEDALFEMRCSQKAKAAAQTAQRAKVAP
jgi:hypothetical protein